MERAMWRGCRLAMSDGTGQHHHTQFAATPIEVGSEPCEGLRFSDRSLVGYQGALLVVGAGFRVRCAGTGIGRGAAARAVGAAR